MILDRNTLVTCLQDFLLEASQAVRAMQEIDIILTTIRVPSTTYIATYLHILQVVLICVLC